MTSLLMQAIATQKFLVWTGMETDLIFNQGIDLPEFASFPLLEQKETRQMLEEYTGAQINVARQHNLGTILESATWMANAERAAPLGYTADQLVVANRDAIGMLSAMREKMPGDDILISGNVGPRGDGYSGDAEMSASDACDYHSVQIAAFQGTPVDLVSGYTITNIKEAIGIVRAGTAAGHETVIAFTVETDGTLPTGETLDAAIAAVDAETGNQAAYFMVNCAHPDHFSHILTGNPRLRGVVVNASRCSHAELDNATELDEGDPQELGQQVAALVHANPAIQVLGGCCGTDARHLNALATAVTGDA